MRLCELVASLVLILNTIMRKSHSYVRCIMRYINTFSRGTDQRDKYTFTFYSRQNLILIIKFANISFEFN